MEPEIFIASAGNTAAPALAVLKSMGYVVELLPDRRNDSTPLLRASKPGCQLVAEDPLLLLGLATLAQNRGADWMSSDEEVDQFLALYDPK